MIYRFEAFSEGRLLNGELSLPAATPIDAVTRKVAHECARVACLAELAWDPFNIRITIRKPPTKRKSSTPCN